MAYICLECGNIFEEGEQARWRESDSGFWGFAYPKTMSGCPICRGEYEEATPCKICGSEHLEEELNNGVCDDCIEKYKHDLDMCFKVGSHDTETIELNCFLFSMFEKDAIEKILIEKLKSTNQYMIESIKKNCEEFVESDKDWFAKTLAEEVKKNENAKG